MRLGEILARRGAITAAQLEAALEQQQAARPHRRIGEILVNQGALSDPQLIEALAEQFQLPFAPSIGDAELDPEIVSHLPVEWARTHAVLPFRQGGHLVAALADPTRLSALDDLGLLLNQELKPVLVPRAEVLRAIERCYFRKGESEDDYAESASAGESLPPTAEGEDLLRMAEQAPVTQALNRILLDAVKQRASDVHFEPFKERMLVRYRVDGFLYERPAPPRNMEAALVSRLKVMARLDIAERRLPQDGMATVRVGERTIDIRVSTLPVAEGERVVLRLLNREATLLPMAQLGMSEDTLRDFHRLLKEPNGIILVTGPTGSGKTTTLYASLQELDTQRLNVMTIEDPIEYQLAGIGQMQVKPKIGLTFAQGLRHILRQDPDVILVGEIRDLETAEIAVRSALTGHLVFSTLHTNDAASAVIRLRDMGLEPYLLASAVKGVMAQRLVRRLCPHCRAPTALNADELRALGTGAEKLRGKTAFVSVGCSECLAGYRGRVGLYEWMTLSPGLQRAVREEADPSHLRSLAIAEGMKTLMDDGIRKIAAGETSVAELLRTVGTISNS